MEHIERKGEPEINYSKPFIKETESRVIQNLTIILFIFLVASILMISFRLFLPAGILLIATCGLIIILSRRSSSLTGILIGKIEEVSESSSRKDNVITDFSHRIREPLNNMVVIGDILINSELDKKQKELVETLIASTKNMVDTLNELTMQSAVTSYEERKKIRFNIVSTIQNTIDLFRLKDPSHIDFIINKKDTGNYEVIGDPIVLKQIFLDIFNIIQEQSHELPSKVTINLNKEKEKDQECIISFRIQTDKKVYFINERDTSGDHLARLIVSGKGSFVQEHGDFYTVFNFSLPFLNIIREEKKQVAPPAIESIQLKEKKKKELKDANVLLVEDNPINQKITLLTLKPLVKNIDTASDGREALEKFGNSTYDLVLMDIQMPVMGGLIAAEKIRALESSTNSHVPIIAITANAMLGDKERCLAAGMDDYISKPFQPAALIDIIKKHL